MAELTVPVATDRDGIRRFREQHGRFPRPSELRPFAKIGRPEPARPAPSDGESCDAVMVPVAMASGPNDVQRTLAMADVAEPFLRVDRAAGERCWGRYTPPDSHGFVTKSPLDTMLFPRDHARSGQPRYTWTERPDGIRLGVLIRD